MAGKEPKEKTRLGEVAVKKGYCTREQVDAALRIQREQEAAGRSPTLSGIIMVQKGIISTSQLIDILRTYEDEEPPAASDEG